MQTIIQGDKVKAVQGQVKRIWMVETTHHIPTYLIILLSTQRNARLVYKDLAHFYINPHKFKKETVQGKLLIHSKIIVNWYFIDLYMIHNIQLIVLYCNKR